MKIKGRVVIIGRPNVGKSTLFNCLTRSNSSIISNIPGVTRDYLSQVVFYNENKDSGYTIYDTGGYEGDSYCFEPLVWKKNQGIIDKADLILYMFDGIQGVQTFEKDLLDYIRKNNKEVIYVVNKIDGKEKESLSWEFNRIGVMDPVLISAAHRKGIPALKEEIKLRLNKFDLKVQTKSFDEGEDSITKVALVGRPNVGKSSILNRLLSEERALVSNVPGTTRDNIDTLLNYNGKPYLIIDTAGIRRPSKVKEEIETASVGRSLRAIDRADVVIIVVDADNGIVDQDARLINLAVKRFKPVLLIVNKWDLITSKGANTQEKYRSNLRSKSLKDMSFIPIHFTSCVKNLRVRKMMDHVEQLIAQKKKIASTPLINKILQDMVAKHPPRLICNSTKRTKFYYATQLRTTRPIFIVKCNVSKDIQVSYKRYMLRVFREKLGFKDIPLQMKFEGKTDSMQK